MTGFSLDSIGRPVRVTGLALLLWGGPCLAQVQAQAQDAATESVRQVESNLRNSNDFITGVGWQHSFDTSISALSTGGKKTYTLDLGRGFRYQIAGVCDENCHNLDLYVRDEHGNMVAFDDGEDSVPTADLPVGRAGTYQVQVVMTECTQNPCSYVISLYREPSASP